MRPGITLVLPVSGDVPDVFIELAKDIHSSQTIKPEIVISRYDSVPFSLSRARNAGAKQAQTEWLAFTDIDTFFSRDLFERMLAIGSSATGGKTRGDVELLTDMFLCPDPVFTHCGFAPMLIKKELFESVGGYCEQYSGWGYEDSDFEHKVEITPYISNAYHILTIHKLISGNPQWNWGSENNRKLFD